MATTDFECPEENSIRNRAINQTEAIIDELMRNRQSSVLPSRSGICIQAGYVYLHLFLRRDELRGTSFDCFANQLKEELEKFQDAWRETFPPEFLFWLLFVGATAAIGRPESQWFMEDLYLSRERLMLKSWGEAKKWLGGVAWIDRWNESAHMDIWTHLGSSK